MDFSQDLFPTQIKTQDKTTVLRVALFSPLRKLFDYYLPEHLNNTIELQPGMRVLVPFGSKEKMGVIFEIMEYSDLPLSKLKPILQILDETNLFNDPIYKLILWASQYYHSAIGEMFETAFPAYLRKGKVLPVISDHNKTPLISASQVITKPNNIKFNELNYIVEEKKHRNPLTFEQQQVVTLLQAGVKTGSFQTFLLEGVTGSGKTEVYMEVIQTAIDQGKQALVLVPEIGLTPQMFERLTARFSDTIVMLHSSLTEKQKIQAWAKARSGLATIVLGTRSAVFTPMKNVGVLIIDEEHDASFKQQEGVRYSARDLLIMRASFEKCPVILGSATPSLETLYNVERNRYQKCSLTLRVNQCAPPKIKILDIRHKKLKEGLSTALIQRIREHLNAGGQILLFLNRRGFAPVFMCYDCGYVAQCKHCDAHLTMHFQKQKLKCHHCDYTISLLPACPTCQSANINPVGYGTERLEAILKQEFPEQQILRIDKDTTRKKGSLAAAFEQIQTGKAQILLGTQMLAKGHHFPNLSLVAILNIDQALFSLDFRSTERLGQLLIQVAGRSGRAERIGEVVLQTCHPTHPLLVKLLQQGYPVFAETLLQERNISCLPPYSYQTLIRAHGKTKPKVFQFLTLLKNMIQQDKIELELWGPVEAPMERRNGQYHAQLLLQSSSRQKLQKTLAYLIDQISLKMTDRSVRWSVDVDPIEMG